MSTRFALLLTVFLAGTPAAQVAPLPSHAPSPAAPSSAPLPAVVARVNSVPISGEALLVATNALVPLNSYHQTISPDKLAELRRQALDTLIDEELRYQAAVRLKVRVSAADIQRGLERARKSHPGGREAFERARRTAGATLAQVREGIRRALMLQRAYQQVVGRSCTVSEADAKSFFVANQPRFLQPEQLRPYLITIKFDPGASKADRDRARQTAMDISQQLASGAVFEDLARQHSSDPSKERGGDLGFVHRGQLVDQLEAALAVLEPGQTSGVIQTIYGFHVVRLAEVRPAAQKSFDEVKKKLTRDLTETNCSDLAGQWMKRLRARARIEIVGERPDPSLRAATAAQD